MGCYNYLTTGAEIENGETFYYFLNDDGAGGDMFYCAIKEIPIDCHAFLDSVSGIPRSFDWTAYTAVRPTYFQYTNEAVDLLMPLFGDKAVKTGEALKEAIGNLFPPTKGDLSQYGARYWAWNLVITKLMHRLEESKLLEIENDGFYHFQRLAG